MLSLISIKPITRPPDAGTVKVLYAASLVSLFENIRPQFERESGIALQGEGEGSIACIRYIKEGIRKPDVFISADPEAVKAELMSVNEALVSWQIIFLGDRMVIAYNPESKFSKLLEKAERREIPWYEPLRREGFRFARTDPDLNPKGYRMLFVSQLSEEYYQEEGISEFIKTFPIYRGTELMARLEIGELDAVEAYAHEAVERKIPFIELPSEINLGSSEFAEFYKKVSYVDERGDTHHGGPIVFSVTILENASNRDEAIEFVKFLLSPERESILKAHGFQLIELKVVGDTNYVHEEILDSVVPR